MKLKAQRNLAIFFIVLLVAVWAVLFHLGFSEEIVVMFSILIPISFAWILFVESGRIKEKARFIGEISSIEISLKEIEKNNKWCSEFITRGPSRKFYNLTMIGVEKCLNTLRFKEEDGGEDFLEAFYMTIKEARIVNNLIEVGVNNNLIDAGVLNEDELHDKLVGVSRNSIKESNELKKYLKGRKRYNKRMILKT